MPKVAGIKKKALRVLAYLKDNAPPIFQMKDLSKNMQTHLKEVRSYLIEKGFLKAHPTDGRMKVTPLGWSDVNVPKSPPHEEQGSEEKKSSQENESPDE